MAGLCWGNAGVGVLLLGGKRKGEALFYREQVWSWAGSRSPIGGLLMSGGLRAGVVAMRSLRAPKPLKQGSAEDAPSSTARTPQPLCSAPGSLHAVPARPAACCSLSDCGLQGQRVCHTSSLPAFHPRAPTDAERGPPITPNPEHHFFAFFNPPC